MPYNKTDQILLGCAVLKAMDPTTPKSQTLIAAACGVTLQSIQFIEYKALRKLRTPTQIKQLKEYKV